MILDQDPENWWLFDEYNPGFAGLVALWMTELKFNRENGRKIGLKVHRTKICQLDVQIIRLQHHESNRWVGRSILHKTEANCALPASVGQYSDFDRSDRRTHSQEDDFRPPRDRTSCQLGGSALIWCVLRGHLDGCDLNEAILLEHFPGELI